jgi:hypothetical protein
MELRKYSRCLPQWDVIVALVSDEGTVLTGSLVDLSISGLAFNFMSGFKCRIPNHAFCGIFLKSGPGPFSGPFICEVVYEIPILTSLCSPASMERCGIKFKETLSQSAVESLLSVPGSAVSYGFCLS